MALTSKEIAALFEKVKPCVLLAGAIAKVYLASPDPTQRYYAEEGSFLRAFPSLSSREWTDAGLKGALLLLFDKARGSVSFEIYNIKTLRCCFAYELYLNMDYEKRADNFHCFEVDDCIMGFSFSDNQAASDFFDKVQSVLPMDQKHMKQRKKQEKASQISSQFSTPGSSIKELSPNSMSPMPKSPRLHRQNSNKSKAGGKGGRGKNGRRVSRIGLGDSSQSNELKVSDSRVNGSRVNGSKLESKMKRKKSRNKKQKQKGKDIEFSKPIVVQKNLGIALLPDGTFNLDTIPNEWKSTFKEAGIRKRELKNPGVVSTIFETLKLQEMLMTYKEQPEYADVEEGELERIIEAQPKSEIDEYIRQYDQHEYESNAVKQYNKEISSLQKWEEANKGILRMSEATKARQNEKITDETMDEMPPPIPARDAGPPPKTRGKKKNIVLPPIPDLPTFIQTPKSEAPMSPALPPLPVEEFRVSQMKARRSKKKAQTPRDHGTKNPKHRKRSKDSKAKSKPQKHSRGKVSDVSKPHRDRRRKGGNQNSKTAVNATLRRIQKRLQPDGAVKTTLVSKLQKAMQERREIMKADENYDSDSSVSDWSID